MTSRVPTSSQIGSSLASGAPEVSWNPLDASNKASGYGFALESIPDLTALIGAEINV